MLPYLTTLARRYSLSLEGLAWLALCLGMLVTGLIKGINLIILLGCILLAVALSNLYRARRQVRGLVLARDLPDFVIAGEPATWRLQLRPGAGRSHHGLVVSDPGPTTPIEWYVDVLPPQGVTLEKAWTPTRRGIYSLAPVTIQSGYPLGLAAQCHSYPAADSLIVAPRVGTVLRGVLRHWLSRQCPTVGVVRSFPIRHPAGQTEFHGLRAYRPGDNPRWIHWRTSARRGSLMTREFEEYPNDDLVVLVDPTASPGQEKLFERLVSLAASICNEWCRQKGDRLSLLIAGPTAIHVHGKTGPSLLAEILRSLAGLEPVAEPSRSLVELLRGSPSPPTAHLLLSLGVSPLPEDLLAALGQPVATVDVAAGEDAEFFDLPEP